MARAGQGGGGGAEGSGRPEGGRAAVAGPRGCASTGRHPTLAAPVLASCLRWAGAGTPARTRLRLGAGQLRVRTMGGPGAAARRVAAAGSLFGVRDCEAGAGPQAGGGSSGVPGSGAGRRAGGSRGPSAPRPSALSFRGPGRESRGAGAGAGAAAGG